MRILSVIGAIVPRVVDVSASAGRLGDSVSNPNIEQVDVSIAFRRFVPHAFRWVTLVEGLENGSLLLIVWKLCTPTQSDIRSIYLGTIILWVWSLNEKKSELKT
jgi:hypothetical protein